MIPREKIVRVAVIATLGLALLTPTALAGIEIVNSRASACSPWTIGLDDGFDQIQLYIDEGGPFDPIGISNFSDPNWAQLCNDDQLLVAQGPLTTPGQMLYFDINISSCTLPLTLYMQTWSMGDPYDGDDDLKMGEYTAVFDGTSWHVDMGDSPWADTSVDCVCERDGKLTLQPDGECYKPGDIITIDVNLSDATYDIVSAQFFLGFDPAKLLFLSANPGGLGDPNNPFDFEVYESVNQAQGLLDYAVGVVAPGVGTSDDHTMAKLTFEALNEVCADQCLVFFRQHDPATYVGSQCCGDICPILWEQDCDIWIDGEAPVFDNCEGADPAEPPVYTAPINCEDVCTGPGWIDIDHPTLSIYNIPCDPTSGLRVTATDNCDPNPSVEVCTQIIDPNCPNEYTIKVSWKTTDYCGNERFCDLYIPIVDEQAPCLIGCPVDYTYLNCQDYPHPWPTVTANDNCTDPNDITILATDNVVAWYCPGSFDVLRTWTAWDECGNDSSCGQFIEVRDTEAPVLDPNTLPANETVECDEYEDLCCPCSIIDATDNCTAVFCLFEQTRADGCCPDSYTMTRTWKYWDECGNSVFYTQYVNVEDTTKPTVSCPDPNITVECDAVPPVADIAPADNCDDMPTVFFSQDIIPGVCDDYYTILRHWLVEDDCGNTAACEQVIHVVDTTPPEITCPPSFTVVADVGECCADVCALLHGPDITDNCWDPNDPSDPAPILSHVRSDGVYPLCDPYCTDSGVDTTTTITYIATDDCGNAASCTQDVTVRGVNLLFVKVVMQMNIANTRCITFKLWDCDDPNHPFYEFGVDLDFVYYAPGQMVAEQEVEVPCGEYNCITARDKSHTLRVTLNRPDFFKDYAMNRYDADFEAAGKLLLAGNMNDDCVIDISDFTCYNWEWGNMYDSDGDGTQDGHTPCGMFALVCGDHGDFTGDGVTGGGDWSYMHANWLEECEANCCNEPPGNAPGQSGEPRLEISVEELRAMGLGHQTVADLNRDGWVDLQDVELFNSGVRPKKFQVDEIDELPVPADQQIEIIRERQLLRP